MPGTSYTYITSPRSCLCLCKGVIENEVSALVLRGATLIASDWCINLQKQSYHGPSHSIFPVHILHMSRSSEHTFLKLWNPRALCFLELLGESCYRDHRNSQKDVNIA